MGMYSWIEDCDVEIVNPEGLKEYVLKILRDELRYSINEEYAKSLLKEEFREKTATEIEAIDATELFTGTNIGWDNWKIIQYWYDEFVIFIRDLSAFIEGEILLEYETEEEKAKIEFTNGVTNIEIGTFNWAKIDKNDLMREASGKEDEFVKRARALNRI